MSYSAKSDTGRPFIRMCSSEYVIFPILAGGVILTYNLFSTASIATLQPVERRSKQSVCKSPNASLTDTGLVFSGTFFVRGWDGFDTSTVWPDTFSFASIGFCPFDPLPVLMSCFFPVSMFIFPFAFKKLNSISFCDTGRLLNVEHLIKVCQYRK